MFDKWLTDQTNSMSPNSKYYFPEKTENNIR